MFFSRKHQAYLTIAVVVVAMDCVSRPNCGGEVEGVAPLWRVINVGEERGVAGHLLVGGQHGGVPGYLLHITPLKWLPAQEKTSSQFCSHTEFCSHT